jgi:hypothetical protein
VLTVADAIRWVGLDVHATQTTVAVIDKVSGELQRAKVARLAEHGAGLHRGL